MTEPLDTIRDEFVNLARRAHGDDAASIAAEAFRVTLAAHDAEVAANALREFAENLDHLRIRRWLRNEADRIERATASETEDASPKIEREAGN